MGWKTINGVKYLYMPMLIGGRVRSVYVGNGVLSRELSTLVERKEWLARQRNLLERKKRQAADAVDRECAEWFARVDRLAAAALVAAGYRKHHRSEWRKTRHAE